MAPPPGLTRDAFTVPFAHLCNFVASEIQDLNPDERFQRLQKLKLKWMATLGTILGKLLNDSNQDLANVASSEIDEKLSGIACNLSEF